MALALPVFAADPLTHRMEKGETLYSISKKYKVPFEALAAANGISDPTKLRIGAILIIPSVHIVAKGETFYGISRQYGITVSALLAANKLNESYLLKVGDALIIPASAPAETGAGASTSTTLSVAKSTMPSAPATTAAPPSTIAPPAPATTIATIVATTIAPAATTTSPPAAATTLAPATAPPKTTVPMPDPVKTQDRAVDMNLVWPVAGKAMYLDGKLEGVMIRVKAGETTKAIAAGTVVSAGPSRGFSQVVFVQAKSGYVYVYGGNESLSVKTGDQIVSGQALGKIGIDAKENAPVAYFFVFRNGQPIDPALAPRG